MKAGDERDAGAPPSGAGPHRRGARPGARDPMGSPRPSPWAVIALALSIAFLATGVILLLLGR